METAEKKTIKVIETEYNGLRFRSRLEARWAVFFDSVGIKYQYEPEGYEVQAGEETFRYLPDFYLPDIGCHAEVKPSFEKLMEDSKKLAWMIDFDGPLSDGLVILGQIPRYELWGDIGKVPEFLFLKWRKGVERHFATFTTGGRLIVNELDVSGCTAPDLINKDERPFRTGEFKDLYLDTEWTNFMINHFMTNSKKMLVCPYFENYPLESYVKASQARFEHGEKPMTRGRT